MLYTIIDSESDGLVEEASKIYVLSYHIIDEDFNSISKGSIVDYKEMVSFLEKQETLVAHNLIRHDLPLFKKILNFSFTGNSWDTLGISWYLYPVFKNKNGNLEARKKHGLEAWGIELGFPKPIIEDWKNLSLERYIERCEGDVEINTRFFIKCMKYLREIYDKVSPYRLLNYLSFKLDCAREQEEIFCKIDKDKCYQYLDKILEKIEEKTSELSSYMPKKINYKKITKPKVLFKKDGSLSSHGEKWFTRLEEINKTLPDILKLDSFTTEIQVFKNDEPGNPGSDKQLKEWLFSLGWQPSKYQVSVSKITGKISNNPKVSINGKICPNIKSMFNKYSYLETLEGLTILKHRKGVFESFIKELNHDDKVKAKIEGFTNTLRFKHRKPIANLTKVGKPWGKEIRSVIITPSKDYILCGSDMSSLEDTTKQHYMYFFDPEYVTQMRVPGFDPHIDIAVFAKLMTKEEEVVFKVLKSKLDKEEVITKEEEQIYKYLSGIRSNAKTVNFAAVYGAGPPKIAETLGCDLDFATKLHKAYWERNKAVKLVAKSTIHKEINGQMWLFNPVSKFWYSLRYEKDKFSTLNQGTGVYCFDSWLRKVRNKGVKIMLQYHDEIGFPVLLEDKEKVKKILQDSISELNTIFKLNVPLGISIEFGNNYSEIH